MEFLSSLNITNDGVAFLLDKRIELLKAIEKEGSISKAAKEVPMSYKSAWDAIDAINNLSPNVVVTKETGGSGGGGAKLTSYGKNLIETYLIVKEEHDKFLNSLSNLTDFNTATLTSLKRVSMQISARNQIHGRVELIQKGGVNSEVFIKLKSGNTLVSIITNSAVESLELKEGEDVVGIFKSSSVLLSSDMSLNISARNKLIGSVNAIHDGEVNSEVIVDIGNEDKIASIITTSSVNSLELSIGDKVCAIIKASDLMIGK